MTTQGGAASGSAWRGGRRRRPHGSLSRTRAAAGRQATPALCRHLDACHDGHALKLQHEPRLPAPRCSPRSSPLTAHIAPLPEFLCSDRTRRPRRRPLRPSPRRRPPRTPPPPCLRLLHVARSAATLLGAPSPFPYDPRSITWLLRRGLRRQAAVSGRRWSLRMDNRQYCGLNSNHCRGYFAKMKHTLRNTLYIGLRVEFE